MVSTIVAAVVSAIVSAVVSAVSASLDALNLVAAASTRFGPAAVRSSTPKT